MPLLTAKAGKFDDSVVVAVDTNNAPTTTLSTRKTMPGVCLAFETCYKCIASFLLFRPMSEFFMMVNTGLQADILDINVFAIKNGSQIGKSFEQLWL